MIQNRFSEAIFLMEHHIRRQKKGRQYGKTTTLKALESYLSSDYIVLSVDFQTIGTEEFFSQTDRGYD